ncbi:MAG: hypothetical protein JOZ54_20705 [Acidobacteria bacterium]|nr:hypothetical protein [Acidobacteriota bacterium]
MARTISLSLLTLLLAASAFAQSEPGSTNEFGRATGAEFRAIVKGPRTLSGTLSLSTAGGATRGRGYEGSVGGEIVRDKMWFFGAASMLPGLQTSQLTGLNAKVTAQPVDWSNVTASFQQLRQPSAISPLQQDFRSLDSTFLALHSTTMLSDRMMMNFSYTQSNVK